MTTSGLSSRIIAVLTAVLVAVLVGLLIRQLAPSAGRRVASAPPRPRPNIILIVTDDQRADTLWAMPKVRMLLGRPGIRFDNGYVSNSLCCPSRATILTGNYSHSNGVYQNGGPYGGFEVLSDDSTVATWLDDGGYRTGLFGKYLTDYHSHRYVPPGWDEWHAFMDNDPIVRYYDYRLNENGTTKKYGSRSRAYSTDVLKRKALDFIETSSSPFFLFFAPYAPHELAGPSPAPPARRHRGDYEGVGIEPSPSFDEEDVSDKPAWVRGLPRITGFDKHQGALESLLAVDDAIGRMIAALRKEGELEDTLIVFTSDNGVGWGEHRWVDKQDPYRGSTNVPFIVRYDRVIHSPDANHDDLVLNLDLAPTFGDAAGVDVPPDVEGTSLLPLLKPGSPEWRADFLLEHMEKQGVPSYCGVRSLEWLYVAYDTGEEELYDLVADPHELENLAEESSHEMTLFEHRDRVQALCSPPPPGYVFPFDLSGQV